MNIICPVFTCISALVSLGFSVEAIMKAEKEAKTNALYAASRSIALVVITVVAFIIRSRDMIIIGAVGMIIVQALDGIVGIKIKNVFKTIGPFLTSIVNMVLIFLYL